MEDTLALERMVNHKLLTLHKEADVYSDPHVSKSFFNPYFSVWKDTMNKTQYWQVFVCE